MRTFKLSPLLFLLYLVLRLVVSTAKKYLEEKKYLPFLSQLLFYVFLFLGTISNIDKQYFLFRVSYVVCDLLEKFPEF